MKIIDSKKLNKFGILADLQAEVPEKLLGPLLKANNLLAEKGYQLFVKYGYRSPEIQTKFNTDFKQELKKVYPGLTPHESERLENIFSSPADENNHHCIGIAVDVLLYKDGKQVKAGQPFPAGDFIENSLPKDQNILKKILKENPAEDYETTLVNALAPYNKFGADNIANKTREQKILRDAMESAGFKLFPSEYWHYYIEK